MAKQLIQIALAVLLVDQAHLVLVRKAHIYHSFLCYSSVVFLELVGVVRKCVCKYCPFYDLDSTNIRNKNFYKMNGLHHCFGSLYFLWCSAFLTHFNWVYVYILLQTKSIFPHICFCDAHFFLISSSPKIHFIFLFEIKTTGQCARATIWLIVYLYLSE